MAVGKSMAVPMALPRCRYCHRRTLGMAGMAVQRRVIQFTVGGEQVWREFDVVRVFEGEADGKGYASEHGGEDVEA